MQVSFPKQSTDQASKAKSVQPDAFVLPKNALTPLPEDTVSLSFSGSTDPKPSSPSEESPTTDAPVKSKPTRNLKKLALGVVLTASGIGLAVASLPITALLAASGIGLPATPVTVGIGFIGGGLAIVGGNTMLKGLSGKSYGVLFQRFLNELMSRDSVKEPIKETPKEPVEDPPETPPKADTPKPPATEEPDPPVNEAPKGSDTDKPTDVGNETPTTEQPKEEAPLTDASKLNKGDLFALLAEHDELKTLTETLTSTQKQFVQHMHKDDSFHLKTDHDVNLAIKELRTQISAFGKSIGYKSLSQRIYDYVESAVEGESSELNSKKELTLSGNVQLLRKWHEQLSESYPEFFKRPTDLLNYINQHVTPYYTNLDDLTSVHQNVDETLVLLAQKKLDAFLSSQEEEAAAKEAENQADTEQSNLETTDSETPNDTETTSSPPQS